MIQEAAFHWNSYIAATDNAQKSSSFSVYFKCGILRSLQSKGRENTGEIEICGNAQSTRSITADGKMENDQENP